ncbi:hypothetical protein [Dyadobacter beijingensis]|uniref:hypothetical protein n=1 Tax=Dyadobacter beijingensis TaxID=365489 RepID=UPI000381DCD4|nr:hypothetical protein [Dyadobacter beijingensis]
MRNHIVLLCFTLATQLVYSQDTIKVTFSQETDTLTKQRFIDKYENVFMTKVPTRHMLKFGLGFYPDNLRRFYSSEIRNVTYEIGYEYKILPAVSIGVNIGVTNPYNYTPKFAGTFVANIQGKWYFDMDKRIRQEKSANNFTGNFLSAVYEHRTRYDWRRFELSRMGIEFGLQRRFLSQGRFEFAVGLFRQTYQNGYYQADEWLAGDQTTELAISTRTNIGLAIGDWKRTSRSPLCEILNCEQFVQDQWKVSLPSLELSLRKIQLTTAFAYERKFGQSPFSVNAQVFSDFRKEFRRSYKSDGNEVSDYTYQLQPIIQFRFYALQKRNIRKGTGGNNLSGIYFAPHVEFLRYTTTKWGHYQSKQHFGPGLSLGYQQSIFKRVYVDIFGAMGRNLPSDSPDSPKRFGTLRIGFGLRI